MKRIIVGALLVCAAVSVAVPREIESDEGASLVVTTRTSFGVDLDHPERYGLRTEFPRLGLYIRLIPWQNVTNKVNSDDPIGFIDLNLGINEIRFTNGAFADDNNPGERVGMGWNDPTRATGYFARCYLKGSGRTRRDISWFQLAAEGIQFLEPWNRISPENGPLHQLGLWTPASCTANPVERSRSRRATVGSVHVRYVRSVGFLGAASAVRWSDCS